jgi:hypothetical protein
VRRQIKVVAGLGREARGRDDYRLEPDSKAVHTATNFGVSIFQPEVLQWNSMSSFALVLAWG